MAKWSVKNINELIERLRKLVDNGSVLAKDNQIYSDCREIFSRLKRETDFDPNSPQRLIGVLEEQLPEIKEIELDELWPKETKLESDLSKNKLDELVAAYEKAIGSEKEAVSREITKRTGRQNVDQFIRQLKKLHQEIETKVAKTLPTDTPANKVEVITDRLKTVADEELVAAGEINAKKIEGAVKRVVGKNEELVRKIAMGVEEIVAEEKVDEFTQDLATKVAKQISDNPEVQAKIEKIIKARVERVVITAEDFDLHRTRIVNGQPQTLKEEIGASVRVGAEAEHVSTVLEEVNLEVQKFSGRTQLIDKARAGVMKDKFETEMVKNLGGEEAVTPEIREAIEDYKTIVDRIFFHRTVTTDIEPYRHMSETTAVSRGVEPARAEQSWHELRGVMGVLQTRPRELNRMVALYRKGNELIGNKLPNIPEIKVTEKLMQLAAENKAFLGVLSFTQRFVAVTDKINGLGGRILIKLGADKLGLAMIQKVGGDAVAVFAKEALTIIGKEGFEKGIMMILKGVLSGGVKAAGTAGATAAEGGGLTAVITAFQAIPVVGQVILVAALVIAAAVVVWKTVIAPILNGVKNFLQKNLNIDLNRVKSFIAEDLGLGKLAGSIGQFFFDAGLFLVGLPAMLATINFTAMIAPVFIFFMVGILGYSLLQSNMISSLVPSSSIGGGNCVLKSDLPGSGEINCDKNAPENTVVEILTREQFANLPDVKKSGSHGAECYNDVVNRSLCAGVNPTYSLMEWLLESGASNYSRENVQDFGINFGGVPSQDFNAQISMFLTIDAGNGKCMTESYSKTRGNYWLSHATSYLTGTDKCDPDWIVCKVSSVCGSLSQAEMKAKIAAGAMKKNVDYVTGRTYLEALENNWAVVGGKLPLPADIHVAKGGQNCGSVGGNSVPSTGGRTTEQTDEEGRVWVCTNTPNEWNYDPNAPGIPGEPIAGECSVADKVVLTKQNDPAWGSKKLPGGCSISSSGCGPASVSMMLRRVNGTLTPDSVIFNPGSAYGSMGCDGSTMAQAATELSKRFNGVTYNAVTRGCNPTMIGKWLCDGKKVVMVLARFYRDDSLTSTVGHFVLAVGVGDSKIITADPFYSTKTPFDGTRAAGYVDLSQGLECLTVDASEIK